MPQEHYVLRCFSCETFQVHIVKKAKKWECKICGAKQSLKKNYGKGSGKDCRAQVMKLNELRVLKADIPSQMEDESCNETLTDVKEQGPIENKPVISKWAEYLDEIEPVVDDEIEDSTDWVNEIIKEKRKRGGRKTFDGDRKKKCRENPISKEVPFVMAEEPGNSSSALSQEKNLKFDYSNRKIDDSCSFIQSNGSSEVKQSKYSKYLDEDESESNIDLLGSVKESSNMFDSNPADLDDILNF